MTLHKRKRNEEVSLSKHGRHFEGDTMIITNIFTKYDDSTLTMLLFNVSYS